MINAEAIDFAGSAANKVGLLGFTNSTDKIEIASLKRQLKEWAQYKTTTDARIISLKQHFTLCHIAKLKIQADLATAIKDKEFFSQRVHEEYVKLQDSEKELINLRQDLATANLNNKELSKLLQQKINHTGN